MKSDVVASVSFALVLQNKFDGSDLFQRYTKAIQNNKIQWFEPCLTTVN